jgi:hypothetical protein
MPDLPRCQTQEARTRSLFDQEGLCPWQASIDFAFTGQASKDSQRSTTYKGLNSSGFITITDHFTCDTIDGTPCVFQGLSTGSVGGSSSCPVLLDEYVHMDQAADFMPIPRFVLFKNSAAIFVPC